MVSLRFLPGQTNYAKHQGKTVIPLAKFIDGRILCQLIDGDPKERMVIVKLCCLQGHEDSPKIEELPPKIPEAPPKMAPIPEVKPPVTSHVKQEVWGTPETKASSTATSYTPKMFWSTAKKEPVSRPPSAPPGPPDPPNYKPGPPTVGMNTRAPGESPPPPPPEGIPFNPLRGQRPPPPEVAPVWDAWCSSIMQPPPMATRRMSSASSVYEFQVSEPPAPSMGHKSPTSPSSINDPPPPPSMADRIPTPPPPPAFEKSPPPPPAFEQSLPPPPPPPPRITPSTPMTSNLLNLVKEPSKPPPTPIEYAEFVVQSAQKVVDRIRAANFKLT